MFLSRLYLELFWVTQILQSLCMKSECFGIPTLGDMGTFGCEEIKILLIYKKLN